MPPGTPCHARDLQQDSVHPNQASITIPDQPGAAAAFSADAVRPRSPHDPLARCSRRSNDQARATHRVNVMTAARRRAAHWRARRSSPVPSSTRQRIHLRSQDHWYAGIPLSRKTLVVPSGKAREPRTLRRTTFFCISRPDRRIDGRTPATHRLFRPACQRGSVGGRLHGNGRISC